MGILDLFMASKNKRLQKEVEDLKALLTPEQQQLIDITDNIKKLETKRNEIEKDINKLESRYANLNKECEYKRKQIVVLDDRILLEDFGLYEPLYDFAKSDEYKKKLDEVREKQKYMIKNKTAVNYFDGWAVDGSKAKGRKMTNDNIKQILRSFNIECENIIDRVKFNNIESMKKRIEKSYTSLNKLNQSVRVSISDSFYKLKLQELHLAYEYQVKKQEEKEEQKRIREEIREEARLQKELDEARKNVNKDLKHFKNALESVLSQLSDINLDDDRKQSLLDKKEEIENQVNELESKLKDIDYRQNNQKAGYVYIISNIGSFGENVYKIGMTRRLTPQDRIDELGDASVPFNFDVHAMIFSHDAPALENALHKALENKKVNMINKRREFFNVTLEEIEEIVKANFDNTVEFTKLPEAEQYRESLKIKQKLIMNS